MLPIYIKVYWQTQGGRRREEKDSRSCVNPRKGEKQHNSEEEEEEGSATNILRGAITLLSQTKHD